MTLEREVGKEKREKAPSHRFSRPYKPAYKSSNEQKDTGKLVERAIEEDKKKYGEEEYERRVRDKIKGDLLRAEKLRLEELEKGKRRIERIERREAEGKDPSKMSTDEEDDGVDNTILVVNPPATPDPRNARFGQPLSTDYRLRDAQRDFEASGEKRTVMWRPGSSPVKSGGDEGGEGGEGGRG